MRETVFFAFGLFGMACFAVSILFFVAVIVDEVRHHWRERRAPLATVTVLTARRDARRGQHR